MVKEGGKSEEGKRQGEVERGEGQGDGRWGDRGKGGVRAWGKGEGEGVKWGSVCVSKTRSQRQRGCETVKMVDV